MVPWVTALTIQYREGGLFLPELALWLDPHRPQTGLAEVVVSHAHADHIGAHREVILSEPTAHLMRARVGGQRVEHILPFRQPRRFGLGRQPFHVTLLPAGHILGSAMAFVEAGGQSLLYTGDFKLSHNLCAEPCDVGPARGCEMLIMETTFGRPEYRFPPAGTVMEEIVRFCREGLDQNVIPVLLAYSMGKSQELLCGLGGAGLRIVLHEAIAKITRIYEQCGVRFPPYERFDQATARGKVLLCPPQAAQSARVQGLGPIRTAVVTGWALESSCRFRYGTDAAFALSDHADFADLVEMVKRIGPKKVLTLHGFAADFAQAIRKLGYEAQALSEDEQLQLDL
jgi:Cft2 family RNA processing exonuclease